MFRVLGHPSWLGPGLGTDHACEQIRLSGPVVSFINSKGIVLGIGISSIAQRARCGHPCTLDVVFLVSTAEIMNTKGIPLEQRAA